MISLRDKARLMMNIYCFGRNLVTTAASYLPPVQLPTQRYKAIGYLLLFNYLLLSFVPLNLFILTIMFFFSFKLNTDLLVLWMSFVFLEKPYMYLAKCYLMYSVQLFLC